MKTRPLLSSPGNKKCLNHFVESYCDEATILSALELHSRAIKRYALILHNKDIFKDDIIENDCIRHKMGDFKEPHYHILIMLNWQLPLRQVQNWFYQLDDEGCEITNRNPNPCTSVLKAFQYLTHKNNPEKYQYNDDEIITDDLLYFMSLNEDDPLNDNLTDALLDYLGGVSLEELVRRYGRDFIINFKNVRDIANEIRFQKEYK